MCDVVYVLHVEKLERHVAADVQAAVVFRAAGADIDIPDLATERQRFDAALIAEPVPESGVQTLIRELGVA